MNEQAPQPQDEPENADELAALEAEAAEAEPGLNDEGAPADNLPAEAEPEVTSAQALEMLLGPAFGLLAPEWRVQSEEIQQLAAVWGEVADKYLPGGVSLGVELNAAIITIMMIGPRLAVPRNAAAKERAEKKKAGKSKTDAAKAEGQQAAKRAEKPAEGERPVIDLRAISDDAENTPTRDTDAPA